MTKRSPFRYFRTCSGIIRLVVMHDIRFPLWDRDVDEPLHERGVVVEVARHAMAHRDLLRTDTVSGDPA